MSAVPHARISIGKVLAELQVEFPDLTVTKIRYLESEGLIEPERTPSKYRKFSFGDLERLRFILRQQKAPHFWPLSHIRAVLDQMDRGDVPDTTLGVAPPLRLADDGLPTDQTFADKPSQMRVSRDDLLDQAGIDGNTLDQLEQHALIERRPNQRFYDGDDLLVAQLAGELAELGLEPRHLRPFRTAAERQATLIDQALVGDTAADAVAALASRAVRLHTLLVRRQLRG